MPYYTTNPAYGNAINNLTKAFIGDASTDTEQYRQQLLQQQSDKVAMETAELQKKQRGRDALAALYSDYSNRANQVQGPIMAGQTRPQVFGGQVYDQMAPDIIGAMIQGDIDPKMATMGSMLPGLSNDQMTRNAFAAGQTVASDSPLLGDKAVYEVAGNSRVVRGDGTSIVDIAPAFLGAENALAEQRRAAAKYDNERDRSSGGDGHKVPKMDGTMNMVGEVAANLGYLDGANVDLEGFMEDMQSIGVNPQELMQIAGQEWQKTGGNSALVQSAILSHIQSKKASQEAQAASEPGFFASMFGGGGNDAQAAPAAPPQQPAAAPEATKVINGRNYVKINGQWFEQ